MNERVGHAPVNVVVVGWRDGDVAERVVCESEEEATALAERWAELDFSRIEIQDLSARHQPGDILEPDLEIETVDPEGG